MVYPKGKERDDTMSLQFLEIHGPGKVYRDALYALYERSFPRLERKPVSSLERTFSEGKSKILAVTEDEDFIGLAVLMTDGRCTLLDYLAIEPDKRDRGYGSQVLRRLLTEYNERPLLVEIERADERAADNADRLRRRDFYLRSGMESSGVCVWLFHVEYELLCANGSVSYEQYRALLTHCMGGRVGAFLHQLR